MFDVLQDAGDAVTGAVVGRAIEPEHGEGRAHALGSCLNCGSKLHGEHCHRCGQAGHIHRTLGAIGHEIAHGVFHFEGKIWRTLPMLAFRPGALTRRYVHGERARFVSPLALFLFCVFLTFAVVENRRESVHVNANAAKGKIEKEIAVAEGRLGALDLARARATAARQPVEKIDQDILGVKIELVGLTKANEFGSGDGTLSSLLPKALPPGTHVDLGFKRVDDQVNEALRNPQLLIYKLQSNAYKYAWALIPLSLPFMWLMFAWRRQYKVYDHAVFVTYSLSAIMLLMVAMTLADMVAVNIVWMIFLIPIHFFMQLKGAYQLGVASALVRTLGLIVVAEIVIVLFSVMLLVLGLLG